MQRVGRDAVFTMRLLLEIQWTLLLTHLAELWAIKGTIRDLLVNIVNKGILIFLSLLDLSAFK